MNYIKHCFILFLLIGTTALQAQNPTHIDHIQFNLPHKTQWTKIHSDFKKDSTQFTQQWGNKKDSLLFLIRSSEKVELEETFKELKEKTQNKFETAPIQEGLIAQKYPYALYKINLLKLSGHPGEGLFLIMETPTTMHIVVLGALAQTLSQKAVNQWKNIFTHPEISLSKTQSIKLTQIILQTSQPELLKDSLIKKRLIESLKNRLRNTYHRNLLPKDIRIDGNKIYLTLRGLVDIPVITQALKEKKEVAIMPIFPMRKDTKFIQKLNHLAFPNESPKTASATMKKHYPIITLATAATKDNLRTFIKRHLKQNHLADSITIYKSSNYTTAPTELYLLNSAQKLAKESDITQLKRIKANGKPVLEIHLSPSARKKVKAWSHQHPKGYLALVINQRVYASPKIEKDISNGVIEISEKSITELFYIYFKLANAYPIPLQLN